jgi:hypothetical protein
VEARLVALAIACLERHICAVAFEMQIAGSRAIRLPFTATVMRAVAATFLATHERQPDIACY